jgi:hypothetical protein
VTAVDHHRLGVDDPRLIIDSDRHAHVRQRADRARPPTRGCLVRYHPKIDTALLGPDQRVDGARTRWTVMGADPSALSDWWPYALLLPTMIPSLVNLVIGGILVPEQQLGFASLMRSLSLRIRQPS